MDHVPSDTIFDSLMDPSDPDEGAPLERFNLLSAGMRSCVEVLVRNAFLDRADNPCGDALVNLPDSAPRDRRLPVAGLENPGSVCYANSTIQALYSVQEFRQTLLEIPVE